MPQHLLSTQFTTNKEGMRSLYTDLIDEWAVVAAAVVVLCYAGDMGVVKLLAFPPGHPSTVWRARIHRGYLGYGHRICIVHASVFRLA